MDALIDQLQGYAAVPRMVLYIAAVVAATIVAVVLRRWVTAAGVRSASTPEPAPYPIAYLAGGTHRAVMAALASLRVRGAVVGDSKRRLVMAGPLPAGSSQLEAAIHELLAKRARYMRDLTADRSVNDALRSTRKGLRDAGYLASPGARFIAFLLCGLPFATSIAAWLIDVRLPEVVGSAPLNPLDDFAAMPATLVALVCTVSLLGTLSRLTPRARKGLRELRAQYRNLTPALSPAWNTYGPVDVAMAVALFGAGVLYSEDPVFAAAAAAGMPSGSSSSSGGGSSCGGDSGGSSCGGSSCGGSSCGGGGGCGGGGCGS